MDCHYLLHKSNYTVQEWIGRDREFCLESQDRDQVRLPQVALKQSKAEIVIRSTTKRKQMKVGESIENENEKLVIQATPVNRLDLLQVETGNYSVRESVLDNR